MASGTRSKHTGEQPCHKCSKLLVPYSMQQQQLEGDLEDYMDKQNPRSQQMLQEFFKYINAFLNRGGGCVVFHVKDIKNIGVFDQKVDDRLQQLIPDGFSYSDVFDRPYDKNHMYYRVKPLPPRGAMSVYDYKTITSLNKGKGEMTELQMRKILAKACSESKEGQTAGRKLQKRKLYIQHDKKVEIDDTSLMESEQAVPKKAPRTVPFQESTSLQAKGFKNKDFRDPTTRIKKLVDYYLEKGPDFVTAFTKMESGGSIYFGITEEKHREIATGWFKAEGIQLNERQSRRFEEDILAKIKAMTWFGSQPPAGDQVKVHFHDDPNTRGTIIEIRVNYYHGVCFLGEGPKLYKSVEKEGTFQKHPIALRDWYRQLFTDVAIEIALAAQSHDPKRNDLGHDDSENLGSMTIKQLSHLLTTDDDIAIKQKLESLKVQK